MFFLGQSHKTIEIKAKINKWDLIKLVKLREEINEIETKAGEKIKETKCWFFQNINKMTKL